MLELSGAIKNKIMSRTEALRAMDNIRSLVEGSVRDWHRVLVREEDKDLEDMRLAHYLTPLSYD